jgi:chemotaxis protein MotB
MARRRNSAAGSANIWPGFVDALATLLLVFIFLLVVFVLAQVLLSQAITGKDEALNRLNRQVAELADLLDLERQANVDLRLNIAQLSSSLQTTTAGRDQLQVQLRQMMTRAEQAEDALAAAQSRAGASREVSQRRLLELESLRRDIEALRKLRGTLEAQVGALVQNLAARELDVRKLAENLAAREAELGTVSGNLAKRETELSAITRNLATRETELSTMSRNLTKRETELSTMSRNLTKRETELNTVTQNLAERGTELNTVTRDLAAREAELGALRDRGKQLQAALASERERTLLAQKGIDEREIRLVELLDLYSRLEEDYNAGRVLNKGQKAQVGVLNQQILALLRQIQRLNAALEASEIKDREDQATITDLGRRLNQALASKVQELTRYRSEFFGKLRDVLGQRRGVRIVGDRFVFQSEVLFGSGSALLEQAGQAQIAQMAATLVDIAQQIPADINWVLRVDGHTDAIPIATAQFPSNWELSSARAIAVVKFMVERGVPANRLAATGFGEFQPLDPRAGEIANRRNRRIEFKLTQR